MQGPQKLYKMKEKEQDMLEQDQLMGRLTRGTPVDTPLYLALITYVGSHCTKYNDREWNTEFSEVGPKHVTELTTPVIGSRVIYTSEHAGEDAVKEYVIIVGPENTADLAFVIKAADPKMKTLRQKKLSAENEMPLEQEIDTLFDEIFDEDASDEEPSEADELYEMNGMPAFAYFSVQTDASSSSLDNEGHTFDKVGDYVQDIIQLHVDAVGFPLSEIHGEKDYVEKRKDEEMLKQRIEEMPEIRKYAGLPISQLKSIWKARGFNVPEDDYKTSRQRTVVSDIQQPEPDAEQDDAAQEWDDRIDLLTGVVLDIIKE
jgi:hypothetical protein